MPYYRRYSRRRKKRPYRRYRRGKNTLARKVNYLLRQNRVNRPQLAFKDTAAASANIFTTPSVITLAPKGSGDVRCTIKSFQIRGNILLTTDLNSTHQYRVVIFTDKAYEGAAVTYSDVYASDSVYALRNIEDDSNEGTRFRVLYDRTVSLTRDTDSGSKSRALISVYKKVNIPSIWDSTSRWEKGGLYMAFIGTSTTGQAEFTYNVRLRHVSKNVES